MKNESIQIANLKCQGCATTIKKELMRVAGVQSVEVDVPNDTIKISYNLDRNTIVNRLYELGYPEATEKNGLLLQLKSYASCMIGRVHNMSY